MHRRQIVDRVIDTMTQRMKELFPEGMLEVILYGSYARNDETDESDVDLMYLVDSPREVISARNWQVGEAAADLVMEYGILVSPVVENRDYYLRNRELLPFFANIQREGVKMRA